MDQISKQFGTFRVFGFEDFTHAKGGQAAMILLKFNVITTWLCEDKFINLLRALFPDQF